MKAFLAVVFLIILGGGGFVYYLVCKNAAQNSVRLIKNTTRKSS